MLVLLSSALFDSVVVLFSQLYSRESILVMNLPNLILTNLWSKTWILPVVELLALTVSTCVQFCYCISEYFSVAYLSQC